MSGPAAPHDAGAPELVRRRVALWRERLAAAGRLLAGVPAGDLDTVLAASDFVAEALLRDAELAAAPQAAAAEPFAAARALADEAEFAAELRRVRRRELARIAWRDLTGAADTASTLAALSMLADAAIATALDFATTALAVRYGTPRSESGAPQALVVIGMGKLGGGELNFSSDIDLVFLYGEGGTTDGPRRIENFEYFTRLGQQLIRLLGAPSAEGFVYRVDMRLRPFGDSGPLVASFAALEDYLQQHGRDWERYAWVKARAITNADRYQPLYRDVVRPFVFRRYLDFGVFESLRAMKGLIQREVERRELEDDVKLGPGGIREIEFTVQAFQLLRGGSDPRLRSPSLLAVLPLLAGQKLLPADAVQELLAAYEFLRRLENRLQMYADEQTHRLPSEPERRARLCVAMRLPDWDALAAALAIQRDAVVRHFQALVLATEGAPSAAGTDLEAAFAAGPDAQSLEAALRATLATPDDALPGALAALLAELRGGGYYRRLDEAGRRRLHALLPRLVADAARRVAPAETLKRALGVLEAIAARTAYLALLNESELARTRLVEVCALGAFLPAQLAAFPLLLDELVDQRLFDDPPSRAAFAAELEFRLAAAGGDAERAIEALRQFRRAAVFRVALFDLTGRLPLMQVSDRLTDVAELIIEAALILAWREVTALYGAPHCGARGALRECGVAAVGYGKLGGYELGYGSDLDLVFLHDSAGEVQETSGPKVLDNAVFFLRLGQKVVHFLTVHTAFGRLYEVDMRLRPSGKGGLLMTHIDAFVEYQRKEAWTWEHQALLHSRAVAGDAALRAAFEAARVELLRDVVRRATLREEVRNMRERMRRELSRAGSGEFDLKQDPGGVADIEFLAQYWVLRDADRFAALVMFPDTIRQLESVGSAALVDHAVIDLLVDAYRGYRSLVHRLALEGARTVVPAAPHGATRAAVTAIWDAVMVRGEAAPTGPSAAG